MPMFYSVLCLDVKILGTILKTLTPTKECVVPITKGTKFDKRLNFVQSTTNRDRTLQESIVRTINTECASREFLDANAYIIVSTVLNSDKVTCIMSNDTTIKCCVHDTSPLVKVVMSTNSLDVVKLSDMFNTDEYNSKLFTLGINPKHIITRNCAVRVSLTCGGIMYPINAKFMIIEAINGKLIFSKVKELVDRYEMRHNVTQTVCMMYNNNPSSAIVIPIGTNICDMLHDSIFFEGIHQLLQ